MKNDVEERYKSMFGKLMSRMGVKKEVRKDNSDSAIAEMLIQGVSMGSLDMEKKLTLCDKDTFKEEKAMAHDFYEFQQL